MGTVPGNGEQAQPEIEKPKVATMVTHLNELGFICSLSTTDPFFLFSKIFIVFKWVFLRSQGSTRGFEPGSFSSLQTKNNWLFSQENHVSKRDPRLLISALMADQYRGRQHVDSAPSTLILTGTWIAADKIEIEKINGKDFQCLKS